MLHKGRESWVDSSFGILGPMVGISVREGMMHDELSVGGGARI